MGWVAWLHCYPLLPLLLDLSPQQLEKQQSEFNFSNVTETQTGLEQGV
jgi:hypothetical protein